MVLSGKCFEYFDFVRIMNYLTEKPIGVIMNVTDTKPSMATMWSHSGNILNSFMKSNHVTFNELVGPWYIWMRFDICNF